MKQTKWCEQAISTDDAVKDCPGGPVAFLPLHFRFEATERHAGDFGERDFHHRWSALCTRSGCKSRGVKESRNLHGKLQVDKSNKILVDPKRVRKETKIFGDVF
jgi:hypothetical protein